MSERPHAAPVRAPAGNGGAAAGPRTSDAPIDLLVIGGGINGAGIARDAAGRGLSVVLCEQADLAQATSSASTKLIHGGLRYLEQYEFRLVREALIEREVLLANAPHIIWPLTFVLPHVSKLRPAWMVRLGLFLYDHLGGRKRLPGSRGVDFTKDPYGEPLKDEVTKGFAYSDCWVEDSRLVVLNAQDARERGAEVLTRTACRRARRGDDGLWHVTLEAVGPGGESREFTARAVVNAAGPWVTQVLGQVTGVNRPVGLRLVKGSHIVVPKLYEGDQAYILQNDDRRIVFAIPYERDYTLLGTTDKLYESDPGQVEIDADERVPPALAEEIRRTIATTPYDWHRLRIDNYIGDHLVRWGWGGSFGTTSAPRLFRKGVKRWGDQRVHPSLSWSGRKGPRLQAPLAHYVDRGISDMIRRLDRYTTSRAQDLRDSGRPGSFAANLRRLFNRFFKCYVLRKGYREGGWGFLIALFAGLYPLLSYLKATLEKEPR